MMIICAAMEEQNLAPRYSVKSRFLSTANPPATPRELNCAGIAWADALTNRRDDHLRRSTRAAHGIGGTGARHEVAIKANRAFGKSRRALAAASDCDRLRGEVWIGVQKGSGNRRRR